MGRKNNKRTAVSDDKDKSVEEWLNEPKLALFNKCVELGLTSTGTKDILATRLYDHYRTTPNQPSQTLNVTSNVDSAWINHQQTSSFSPSLLFTTSWTTYKPRFHRTLTY